MGGTDRVRWSCRTLVVIFLVLLFAPNSSFGQYGPSGARAVAPVANVRQGDRPDDACTTFARDPRAGLNVDQCGAYGDNNAHDDTAAINRALAASKHVVCTPGKTYAVRGTLAASANQIIDFAGCTMRAVENPITKPFMNISVNNVTVNDLHLTGAGYGIQVGATGAASNVFVNRFNCDSDGGGTLGVCTHLYTVTNFVANGGICKNAGYCFLQETGHTVRTVRISNWVVNNAYADFFEQNGTNSGPMYDVHLDRITDNGCNGFPTPATECRFIGTTSVQGLVISNSYARNITGDACLHFEGTSAHIQMFNTVLIDCQVSGGNDGYIYFLTSSADFQSTHNMFRKTAKLPGSVYAFSTLSGSYSNPISSIDDSFIDENATHSLGGFDLAFHNGTVTITNPTARDIRTFISINSTTGVSWTGGNIVNATNGVLAENIGQASGGGGVNISVKGAHINCTTWCARSSTNTNGTGPPTNWSLTGNVYTGGGRVLLDDAR